jgi:small subunit ribosomal protein S1
VLVAPGDEVDVLLEEAEGEGRPRRDLEGEADRLKIWDDISKAYKADEAVEGVVLSRVKGGLAVDIGVKAFLPGSQVDLRPVRNLEHIVGQRLQFKIIKFNKRRANIVLSRRALLESERKRCARPRSDAGARPDRRRRDQEPDRLRRVHRPRRHRRPAPRHRHVVGPREPPERDLPRRRRDQGQGAQVRLGQRARLARAEADPARPVDRRVDALPDRQADLGPRVSLAEYGAFLELEPGIEGLVHVSEMSWTKRIKHPSKVVNVGDAVEAVVLDVDERDRKISLGMKQIEPNPWSVIEQKYPVGTRVSGAVRNVTNFGVFVGLEEGIDGLVHVSDISWTEQIKHPSEKFNKGDVVEAVVLKIDKENEKFSLGIKQLQANPLARAARQVPGRQRGDRPGHERGRLRRVREARRGNRGA